MCFSREGGSVHSVPGMVSVHHCDRVIGVNRSTYKALWALVVGQGEGVQSVGSTASIVTNNSIVLVTDIGLVIGAHHIAFRILELDAASHTRVKLLKEQKE